MYNIVIHLKRNWYFSIGRCPNGQLNEIVISLQIPVVQTLDSVVHRINHYLGDNAIGFLILIRWIVIYAADLYNNGDFKVQSAGGKEYFANLFSV